jgi:ubiquinone/menaquinone biosynthesis C-methylase UbiE
MRSSTTPDPYRRVAGIYDRLFGRLNQGLRVMGIRMFRPPPEAAVLDVGCGTGAQLEMYQRYTTRLFGVDTSPSMLRIAADRLGGRADLRLANATHMPFDDDFFDLAMCMLALHEMDPPARVAVLGEMERVTASGGRLLLIDFHAGRPRSVNGWLTKSVILISEVAAGRRHFRNYRRFISSGGLPELLRPSRLTVEREAIVGGNTLALYLVRVGNGEPGP